jgi:hypothetical protein
MMILRGMGLSYLKVVELWIYCSKLENNTPKFAATIFVASLKAIIIAPRFTASSKTTMTTPIFATCLKATMEFLASLKTTMGFVRSLKVASLKVATIVH